MWVKWGEVYYDCLMATIQLSQKNDDSLGKFACLLMCAGARIGSGVFTLNWRTRKNWSGFTKG